MVIHIDLLVTSLFIIFPKSKPNVIHALELLIWLNFDIVAIVGPNKDTNDDTILKKIARYKIFCIFQTKKSMNYNKR